MSAERIAAGIRAFAAADALGAPWEGRSPDDLRDVELTPIPVREDWPRGATSDDTASLLLVAEVLAGGGDGAGLLERLADAEDDIRGMGPSTRAAIERYRRCGTVVAPDGSTNGAAMRAPALGWAAASREVVRSLTVCTHGTEVAVAAASAIAAVASALLDGQRVGAAIRLGEEALGAEGPWSPPDAGISLDAMETVRAVFRVLERATSVADAAFLAIRLGGDTDTVAALACGLLAPAMRCTRRAVRAHLARVVASAATNGT